MMPDKFVLTRQDQDSATWAKMKVYLELRLDILRKKNDGSLSDVETARVRGQIAMIKELLGLDTPTVNPTD